MNPKAGAAPRAVAVLFISIALLKSCGVEALCRAEEHSNGTTYILDESIPECKMYYWCVNGTVVAYEASLNRSLVLKCQFQRITLTGCHKDVTHKNVCKGVLTNCSYTYCQSPWSSFGLSAHCCFWRCSGAGHHVHLLGLEIKVWFQCRRGTCQKQPYTKMLMKMKEKCSNVS
ncbi:uncharacterized protein LOC108413126 isoform X2 [Pygocentrus nattereri]|uniref:uncharacterized protein LOC108413126 isoform X2 n=1 Tax=Pygocentrus nattereri TaxID=42514 RepID=UPI001891DB21|nr:uncharacterized protein LOC108413126 isoform X2 [Pygocentrus nattereri]XP_037393272.1 uncharacterized protein LOC108413126 isoform X2 [Pygocentrus nattereri]